MKLEELLAQLWSADETDRIYAAEDLGILGDSAGLTPLVDRLGRETSRAVRDSIFDALAKLGDESVIQHAILLLSHEDPSVRNEAITLIQAKGILAMPELRKLVCSEDSDLRKFAVDAVSKIAVSSSGDDALIAKAVHDSDINVAISAMENIGPGVARQLRSLVLEKALGAGHPMLKAVAFEALVRTGDKTSFQAVREQYPRLEGVEMTYLISVLKLTGAHGSQDDLVELGGLLASWDSCSRLAALEAMKQLLPRVNDSVSEEQVVPQVVDLLLKTTASMERYEALLLLAAFQSTQARQTVLSYLESPNREDRLAVICALGGDASVQPALQARISREFDPEVKEALNESIRELSK